ncbi:MAG: acyl-ACP--UDP-N-acetylglucosamine O-acyltransferase [Candidatus Omnitrophota bacterium]
MKIHPTAVIAESASIAEGVEIGPYSVIEEDVAIGQNCRIGPHAYICNGTTIGPDCHIHKGAVLGDAPQDTAYKGERTYLKIGERNTFREYTTIHRGTKKDSATVIGNDNYFMAFAHVAHNCQIGNNVTMCNYSFFGGYVVVEDKAFISARCGVQQFTRIGRLSFLAGGVRLTKDLPPFMMAGDDNTVSTFNLVGLKRAGLDLKVRSGIKEAYRCVYRSGLNLSHALDEIDKTEKTEEVSHFVDFIRSSERGVCFAHSNRTISAN